MEVDTLENNHARITNLLQERENERKKEITKKRIEKDRTCAEHEQVKYFREEFEGKKLEIDNALQFCGNVQTHDLANHFDNISKQISLLQKFVSSSTLFLKEYEIRRCQEILQNLTAQARNIEDNLLPKKKFGFKKKIVKKEKIEESKGHDIVDHGLMISKKEHYLVDEDFCGVKCRNNETFVLVNDTIHKKDVTLQSLTKCVVKLIGSPSTLHMNCLKDCVILCGPVSTSVFAENCQNSKLIFACQQLRLHNSKSCDIYLHVTSRAIMEDSSQINFTPYNFKYPTLEADFQESGLDIATNNWSCVDDFNWLSSDIKSPNWGLLRETDRIVDWDQYFN